MISLYVKWFLAQLFSLNSTLTNEILSINISENRFVDMVRANKLQYSDGPGPIV